VSTAQKSIISGYNATSTAEEIAKGIDLSGKLAIVTGGYSGIGLETTRILVKTGATVIAPARSVEKARRNLEGLPRVEIEALDLTDPLSIDAFAHKVLTSGRPVNLLINNAGVMAPPLTRDSRGNEIQFSGNHLGHFQLALQLWPALVKSGQGRVIALSSRGHRFSGVDFNDPNFDHKAYDKWKAYGQSKTANALFALRLDKRGQPYGVRAFSVHPGGILTDLTRHFTEEDLKRYGLLRSPDGSIKPGPSRTHAFKTVAQGAATTIWCAVSPRLQGMGGVYCENCDIAEMIPGDVTSPTGVAPHAADPELAEKLWNMSEQITGVGL
jgi:NAD(P)-dependent dehydrogenase (short-subunit alcohol dehydrogenase family)